MADMNNTEESNVGENVEQPESSCLAAGDGAAESIQVKEAWRSGPVCPAREK